MEAAKQGLGRVRNLIIFGRSLPYTGKIDGETIKGTIDFDFAGQTGSIGFEGGRGQEQK